VVSVSWMPSRLLAGVLFPVTEQPVSENPLTLVPRMPSNELLCTIMLLSDRPDVLARLIAPLAEGLLLMVPPDPAVDPLPVTLSPPLPPVVLSKIAEFALAVVDAML